MKVIAEIRYEKLNQIGIGKGMNSRVFQVNEPQLGGLMVAKEVEKKNFRHPISDYYAEAKTMFTTSHTNVVPIQYACETADLICLVMPYFKNGSLSDRIETGPITVKESLRVGLGVLAGLSKIHVAGYAHFDIKPSNVLFSDTHEPMVADFGQATRLSALGTTRFPPVYPHGIPPEFYSTGIGTAHSDIYHVGLLLYRAVNGDPFFERQIPTDDKVRKQRTLAGKYPDRNAFMPHIPKRVRTLIRKAMQVDPLSRYQTATEFARELGKVGVGTDWSTAIGPDGSTTWRAVRPGQPDLVVELQRDSVSNTWNVCVYTDRLGSRRLKEPGKYRRNNLNRAAADVHLGGIFQDLG